MPKAHIHSVKWEYHASEPMLEVKCFESSHFKGIETFLHSFGEALSKPLEERWRGKEAAYETAEERGEKEKPQGKPHLDFSTIKEKESGHTFEIRGEENINVLVQWAAKKSPALFETFVSEEIPRAMAIAERRARKASEEAAASSGVGPHLAAVLKQQEEQQIHKPPREKSPPPEPRLFETTPHMYQMEPVTAAERARTRRIDKERAAAKSRGE